MLMERHHLDAALKTTGVPFRFSSTPGHWNIVPASNLKPWAKEEQAALEEAARKIGGQITYKLTTYDGRYYDAFTATPGRGFRVDTGSGTDTLNVEAYRALGLDPESPPPIRRVRG
jgi:hypothetical protein